MPDEIKPTTTKLEDAVRAINNFHTKYVAFKKSCAAAWKDVTDYGTEVKNLPFDLLNEGQLWGERGLVAALQYANQEFLTDGERQQLAQLIATIYGKAQQAAVVVQDKIVKETQANKAQGGTSTVAKSKTAKKKTGAGAAKGKGKKSVLEQGDNSSGGIILKPKALQGAKDEFNDKYGQGAVKW